MANERPDIGLGNQEAFEFLRESQTVICATIGPRDWPHLSPLWFVVGELEDLERLEVWSWTYRASQKVRNLERDPRSTLLVESGTKYEELRGLMIETEVELVDDARKFDVARRLLAKYSPSGSASGEPPAANGDDLPPTIVREAGKRIGLHFVERRRTSWDHRKLEA